MKRKPYFEIAIFATLGACFGLFGGGSYVRTAFFSSLVLGVTGFVVARTESIHQAILLDVLAGWPLGITAQAQSTSSLRYLEGVHPWFGVVYLFLGLPSALVLLTMLSRRIGTARPGSVLDGIHKRSLCVACAILVAALIGLRIYAKTLPASVAVIVAVTCGSVSLLVLLLDIRAFDVILRPVSRGAPVSRIIDVGVGHGVHEFGFEQPSSYRTPGLVMTRIRGARPEAAARICRALFLDALGVGAGLVALGVALNGPMTPRPPPGYYLPQNGRCTASAGSANAPARPTPAAAPRTVR